VQHTLEKDGLNFLIWAGFQPVAHRPKNCANLEEFWS